MPIHIADAYSGSVFAQRQTGLLFNLPVPESGAEQLPEGVSLCMIVKNEERFLAECLESVKDCVDEICIVDTGSTDRTVEIARSYGARIEFREWRNDFSWARNESLAMATRRWTLVLDADEELTSESPPMVRALRTVPAGEAALYLNIVNIVNDSMGTGTMSHRLVRCFPTNPQIRYVHVIHECLTRLGGGVLAGVLTPITILHKGYTVEMLSMREKDSRNKPLLARAYQENGDDPFALFNFGNSAIASGDFDLGIEVLERMLALPTEAKMYYPLAYIMLGQAYLEGKLDYDTSLERLTTARERFPLDAGVLFVRGQILARMKRFDEAREAYQQTLTMRDQMIASAMTDEEIFEWKAYCAMAATYEFEGETEKAREWILKAVANKPQSPYVQRILGQMDEKLGRYYDAEIAFRHVAEFDKKTGAVHLMNFLVRRGRFGQAIKMIEAADDNAHNDELIVRLNCAAARSMMEHRNGDPMPFIEAALRRTPGDGNALALYEELLTARNDHAGVARLHASELELPLQKPADCVRRSYRLLGLGRPADALEAAELGLAFDPSNPELRFNAALALARLGRDAEASDHLKRIESTTSSVFVDAVQMHAALLARMGDIPGAANATRAWIFAMNADANAIVTSARWLAQSGGRDEAQGILRDHVDADQRIATELAAMLMHAGDLQGAGAVAERALR